MAPPWAAAPSPCAPQPRGEEDKGCTREEFHKLLCALVSEARRIKKLRDDEVLYLSFDNATIHNLKASHLELPPHTERLALPVYSPDLNKVIEHTWGRFKAHLTDLVFDFTVQQGGKPLTPAELRVLVGRALRDVTDRDVIAADVRGLRLTCEAVRHAKDQEFDVEFGGKTVRLTGTGGDWAPKRLR